MKAWNFKIQLVAFISISLLLAGCGNAPKPEPDAPPVRCQVIKMGGAMQQNSYSGEVRGRYESQLAFQVSGKIVTRHVDLGSEVNAGDVLMEIDSKDIQQNVNMGSAQVASAQAQLNLAANNLTRYQQLYEQDAISQAQLDQYQAAYRSAQAAVEQASAQYTQSSNQLGYSALCADSGGVISAINAEAGQVVSAGQPVLTLVKDGEREIEISVPENRVDELRKAEKLQIAFWALPGVSAEGKVREISPIADKVSRTYKVRVSILNPPPGVKLGMTASVSIATTANAGLPTVYVPLSAIYQNADVPCVWIVENDSVSLRPVKIGTFGNESVQIIEGLNEGDTIVTAGVHKLSEGQRVRVAGDNQ